MKAFIKNDYDNLFCVDIICHGVPSPKLFDKYIKELEEKNGKLLNYNFRDKTTGWDSYSNTMTFEKKKISEPRQKNVYMKLFLSDIALRESCYDCKFKLGKKYSDITLGDFWGIKNYYPEMYSKDGVSAIIINTEKGQNIFSKISINMNYKECKLEEIANGNKSLIKSAKYNEDRDSFFDDLEKLKILDLKKKYYKEISIGKRIILKAKSIIKKLIKH